jgi:predicted acetyltransferase
MESTSSALKDLGALRDRDLLLRLDSFTVHRVHKVPAYYFRMVHANTLEELGVINLRSRTTSHVQLYAGHIGYGVHETHRGHHYAARSVRLLMPVARRLDLNPLWITCNPENAASRRTAEIAGARLIEIVDVPKDNPIYQDGHPRKCRYRLDLD